MAGYTCGINLMRFPNQCDETCAYIPPMLKSATNIQYDNFGYPIYQNKMGTYGNANNWRNLQESAQRCYSSAFTQAPNLMQQYYKASDDYFKEKDNFINSQPQYSYKQIPLQNYNNFQQHVQPQVPQFTANYFPNAACYGPNAAFNTVPMPYMSYNPGVLPQQQDMNSHLQQQQQAQRQYNSVTMPDMSYKNPVHQVPLNNSYQLPKENIMANTSVTDADANKQVKDHSFKKPLAPAPRSKRKKSAKSTTKVAKNSTYMDCLGQMAANIRSEHSAKNICTSVAQQAPTHSPYAGYYDKTSSSKVFDEHLQELVTPDEQLPKDEATANAVIEHKMSLIEADIQASTALYLKAKLELFPVRILESNRPLLESANPKRREICRRSRLKEKVAKASLQHKNDFISMEQQNVPVVLENMRLMVENIEKKLLENGKNLKEIKLSRNKYGIK